MIGSMIGTVANIVLDPVLISGMGMGAAGAAVATTIGNILASIYYLWYFLKKSKCFSISIKYFTCKDGILSGVCVTGLPTAVFSMLMSVSTIVLNQILVAYGNAPVAAIGIVFKANMFITFYRWDWQTECSRFWDITMVLEITSGLFPWNGIQKKCCVIVGILATALFFVLREPIIRLFISDGEVVYYGVKMLIAYMLSGPVIGLLFVNMNCMQSVGNSFPATILSVMRQGLLLIPLLYLLNACMGLNGVIYGQAFTDYAAVILSAVLWRRIRRRIERR